MGKTNAKRQKECSERNKMNDPKFLDKERKQQKKYYVPLKKLTRKKQKRKEEVRKRVTNFRVREASKSITSNKSKEDEPLLQIKMTFPNRGTSSRKKRQRK